MPKGAAAKFIARDLRKHKEERRKKIKKKGGAHDNQHEYLRQSTRKMRKGPDLLEMDSYSESSDSDGL